MLNVCLAVFSFTIQCASQKPWGTDTLTEFTQIPIDIGVETAQSV
jgi:hypothetical protein